MDLSLLQRLFAHEAFDTAQDTRAMLRGSLPPAVQWQRFFERIHDLKAQAMACGLDEIAQRLHGLEDKLWSNRTLPHLQSAQRDLEIWFTDHPRLPEALLLKDVLELLASEAQARAHELEKSVVVHVQTASLWPDEAMPSGLWAVMTHLIHNALIHGVGHKGQIWLNAYHDDWSLVVEVEDDGSARFERSVPANILAGRGVGLASARHQLQERRGELSLNDSIQGGTRARVKLPLQAKVRVS